MNPPPDHLTRTELLALLDAQGQRFHAARAALADGGAFVVWDGLVQAALLATVYARRRRSTVRRGTPTTGLDDTLDVLVRLGRTSLRLGRIDAGDGAWTPMLFLSADSSAVIACTSVKRPSPNASGPRR
ncbi:hypothetical protein [Nonomuraea sp. NPDC049646]|uniref:hypothetical protein n=1 Tax=unclassified Nonomuraea TaxID=2593643 RepID=UPI0037ACA188